MKILDAKQLKVLEQETLANQYISSFKLIEKAAAKLVEALGERHKLYHNNFVILCGKGNNGADGLALARLLKEAGAFVKVYLWQTKKYGADNIQHQEVLEDRGIKVEKFTPAKHKIAIKEQDIIIDALFGIGLRESLEEEWSDFFTFLNEVTCVDRIAIDVPSGMQVNGEILTSMPIFRADMVYTFQVPKLNFLLPENKCYVGDFKVIDIQLDEAALAKEETRYYFLDKQEVINFVHKPSKFSHKGTFGHGLIIGGSYGKMGAVVLASKAVLKVGAGLVTSYIPKCGYQIVQSALIEGMCEVDNQEEYIANFIPTVGFSAVGIGVGLGQQPQTVEGFRNYLMDKETKGTALVLDADAINILAKHSELVKELPINTILTPHPKELERLIGPWENDSDKLAKAKQLAQAHQLIIVIKGAHTAIILPSGEVYFNSTGHWGMGTAGAGDVLTGILVGLLSQGYTGKEAALLGVYLHGLSGLCAIEQLSPFTMLASDLISNLSAAYIKLMEK